MFEKKYGIEDLENVILSSGEIKNILQNMASKISDDYQSLNLTILAIMNGSLYMTVDLMRMLKVPCQIESIKINSYIGDKQNEDEFFISNDNMAFLEGRDILVIDEIFDSGMTMKRVLEKLDLISGLSSIRSAVLLMKNRIREIDYMPDYIGFNVDDDFLVGYGLDFFGNYRNLPSIGILKSDKMGD
jgi:hypoxanthine phosphoribosyltransferase